MSPKRENTDPAQGQFNLKILRYDRAQDRAPHFECFPVQARKGMTVLEALFKIQEDLDPTLAFRYSCRGAVCGSCGMVINGHPNLACRVQLSQLPSTDVLLEPLPNLPLVKDLLVDMEPFWEAYRFIEPWLMPGPREAQGEHRVTEKNHGQVARFVNCILCACCYGSCPAVGRDETYLGPAALAKLFRFIRDSRDRRDWNQALGRVNGPHGVWGCDTVFRCVEACPKEVRPTDGITGLRRRLLWTKCAPHRQPEKTAHEA